MALVSIIIPCFNAEPRLKKALESVFSQTHRNLEILFVDNNSTDRSLALVRAAQRESPVELTILECPQQGAAYARGLGFERARGDYVQWLDADDELDPRKIEHQVAALEADPSADIASGAWRWRFHQDGGEVSEFAFGAMGHDDMIHRFLLDDWQPSPCYLVRRRLADKLHAMDGWHKGARAGDDRQYFGYAAILGSRFVPVPESIAIYNMWSKSQLTMTVPGPERHTAILSMFQNFRRLAAEQPPGRIRDAHRVFLELPRALFILSEPGGASLAEGEGPHANVARAIRDEEMWKQCWMLFQRTGNALEILALCVVRRLWRLAVRDEPSGGFDALRALTRFHAMLGLPRPESLPRTNVPFERMDAYPPPAPILVEYRETALRLLLDLRRDGILVPVSPPS